MALTLAVFDCIREIQVNSNRNAVGDHVKGQWDTAGYHASQHLS